MSKKLVRERMARTGESYQQTLVAMREGKLEPRPLVDDYASAYKLAAGSPEVEHCMRDPSPIGACQGPGRCSCECNICMDPR